MKSQHLVLGRVTKTLGLFRGKRVIKSFNFQQSCYYLICIVVWQNCALLGLTQPPLAKTHPLAIDQQLFSLASIFEKVLAKMATENQHEFCYMSLGWQVEILLGR